MGIGLALKRIALLTTAMALSACGGGGSDNDSGSDNGSGSSTTVQRCATANPLVTQDDSSVRFSTQSSYVAGQSSVIMASLIGSNSQGLQFRWEQLEGPSLSLVSQNSPVLGFDIPSSGSYRFSVHISGNNTDVTGEISITADTAVESFLNVRQDHQVVEGNNVSLRIGQQAGLSAANITWCIAEGPDVTLDLTDPFRPQFVAPTVNQDTVTHLRASASINGNQVSDDAFVLITAEPAISSDYFDEPVARTHAYRQDSPYADVLASCVYSNQLTDACSISKLPLIGQTSSQIDIEAILDRVLVSHDWMGDNFTNYLRTMDPNSDFATLLQSVTAVVISYDVRPSFYWVLTGAIYLDPTDLWLTPSERDTINEAPDYRSAFGNDLNFLMPWRYVKNNQYASPSFPITTRANRTFNQINPDLASLLYHELAHANDFFPRSAHASLTGPRLVDDFSRRGASKSLISDQVTANYPLTSSEMFALGKVSFQGEKATASQKAYQPADITSFFSNDIASDFYAYSSTREDTAMLFEEAMMSYRYQILRDVAVTNAPDVVNSDTVIVDWGQRGRIGDDSLQARAALVIDGILPELDGDTLVAALPEPIAMQSGKSWRANLSLSSNGSPLKMMGVAEQNVGDSSEHELRLSGDRHRQPQQ
ncbi:hypothetical protein L9G16_16775 [Shewanella sp. A25]|nr:hypothetical protein [Shewanella shenzhenensis]